MNKKFRLLQLVISLVALILIGRILIGDFLFMITDFWFTAGLLLLILFSLVDQPFFSTESNVFINSVTAWMSLMLIPSQQRYVGWYVFFAISTIFIITSYFLMWLRKNKLSAEPPLIRIIAIILTRIGRPEVIFSSFFIWGVIARFGINSNETNAFFLFWAFFMIVNIPAVARRLSTLKTAQLAEPIAGVITGIVEPSICYLKLNASLPVDSLYKKVDIKFKDNIIASGLLIDDRVVNGERLGKLTIIETNDKFSVISDAELATPMAFLSQEQYDFPSGVPLSVVDVGTELGKLCFYVSPSVRLQEGEVVWVNFDINSKGFYQIVSAKITSENLPNNNGLYFNRVIAGQLGTWNDPRCRFEPISWVPQAGSLVLRTTASTIAKNKIPTGHLELGGVPNTNFPVHVNLQDIVSHNTAIIGVTGSGKSFLSFRIIEELASQNIKVMILDLSRQHWIYLEKYNKLSPLATSADIISWLDSDDSMIGIYQFANENESYPRATAEYVRVAFEKISEVKLKAGENEPAKLCIVFEEAHSLIPEWNQVSTPTDSNHVNRTARYLLQGRKYGMGCLLITQRTANVTKTILNQCNTIFALQSFDQTGLDFLKNYMGEDYAHTISTLPVRHMVLVGKASSSTRPILFKVIDLHGSYN